MSHQAECAYRKMWLHGKPLTVEQVEQDERPTAEELASRLVLTPGDEIVSEMPDEPFGFINHEWEKLKAAMQPGDELRRYRSDDSSWAHLYGREGIALVRNGEVVDFIDIKVS